MTTSDDLCRLDLCRLCEGPVVRRPGQYLMVFAMGKGPKSGTMYLICSTCAAGVL